MNDLAKKILADSRFTGLTLSAEQRDNVQRIITPAIDQWKAGATKQGIDGDKLLKGPRVGPAVQGRIELIIPLSGRADAVNFGEMQWHRFRRLRKWR